MMFNNLYFIINLKCFLYAFNFTNTFTVGYEYYKLLNSDNASNSSIKNTQVVCLITKLI